MKDSRKRAELVYAMEEWKCKTFVETGTYMGDTIGFFRHFFENIYSIEIDHGYFFKALHRFKECSNVHIFWGDSGEVLPGLLVGLQEPVLFWLDAHGEGWKGPILTELEAIFKSGIKGVTMVDDVGLLPDVLPKGYTRIGRIARYVHVG